jgi:peptidoglycan/xylan/chitin deacetylase (PgdA/CDA1 family)
MMTDAAGSKRKIQSVRNGARLVEQLLARCVANRKIAYPAWVRKGGEMTVAAAIRSLVRRFGRRGVAVPILYYHEVGTARTKHVVHHEDFAAHVMWLRDSGFEVLALDDLVAIYAGKRALPSRPVVLTFDDGRAGVLRNAAPVLHLNGLPATAYVVTDWADGGVIPGHERYSDFLGWREIEELRSANFQIGSHTVTHRNLKRVSAKDLTEEVRVSRQRLEDRLGEPIEHFSFPKGRAPRRAVSEVRRAGYRTAVVTGQRWNGRLARLHRLGRLRVDGREGPAAVQRLLGAAAR